MSRNLLIGVKGITPPRPALPPVRDHLTHDVEPSAPQESRGRRILNIDVAPAARQAAVTWTDNTFTSPDLD